VEKYGRTRQATDDSIIRRMRIACWIPKSINTHSEYVIIIAFPLQQWFCDSASMLRYKSVNIASLIIVTESLPCVI